MDVASVVMTPGSEAILCRIESGMVQWFTTSGEQSVDYVVCAIGLFSESTTTVSDREG